MEKLTRKRKWMMGVLALGVGALVMDRTLLGPPETASASDAVAATSDAALVQPAASTDASAVAPATVGGEAPADLSAFAQRLAAMPQPTGEAFERDDAFDLPKDWAPTPLAGPQAVAEDPRERTALARAFHAAHTLNGTMNADGVDVAVVNGQPYRVGAALDGFVLKQVANRMALWQSTETGEMVVLRESPQP